MPEKAKILLLEDDPNLGIIVQEHLQMNGYEVSLAANGAEGLELFDKNRYDLCLVDIMMPKVDGFSFARKVRSINNDIPLIFLTAKALKEDKIEGFKIGCDDYITKPFSVEELLLRIQAVLKRSNISSGKQKQIVFKIGLFDFDSNRQVLSGGGTEQKLTAKEAELLKLLCLNKNRTLKRSDALNQIWGSENYFNGRSMDVFISKLRKYLNDDKNIEIINLHGVGFKLIINEN